MSRTQSSMLLILLPGLACAAMVRSYPRLSTHQSSDSQHNDMGLLGYAFAVRTSQIPGPWSWALDWALCALRQLTGPLQRPTPERRGATTAPRETHVVSGWDGPAAGTGAGAGAGPEMLARGGDVRGGDGSGSTASFGELYGYGEGSGGVGNPVGACYDIFTDALPPVRTGAPGGSEHDRARGSSTGGGGGDGNGVVGSEEGRAAAGLLQTGALTPASVAGGKHSSRPSVIYLPPLTGTELQGKLNKKPSTPRWWCRRRTSSWFRLWATLESLLPWEFPCFADNLRLTPGDGNSGAVPPLGVEVRLGPTLEPPQGNPRIVGLLQPWSTVADALRRRGWTDDLLDTHAYDWRLSPAEWSAPGGSFQSLRAAISSRVAASGGRRVVLLGLSLGASYAVSFLNSKVVDQEWKETHMERLVTLSGVWSGTPRSTWDVISGRLQGLEAVLDGAAVRQLLRGIPALAWTFPAPPPGATPGDPGGPVVITNTALGRDYSTAQLGQALRDAGAPETSAFWEAALPFALASPPNVSTHCFYSYGLRTAVHVTYARADFSDTSPMVRYDDGDLTVPHASLVACRGWAVRQVASVRSHSFFGVVHGMLTSLPEALEDILDAIAGEAG